MLKSCHTQQIRWAGYKEIYDSPKWVCMKAKTGGVTSCFLLRISELHRAESLFDDDEKLYFSFDER
jgi:hypothetical protein